MKLQWIHRVSTNIIDKGNTSSVFIDKGLGSLHLWSYDYSEYIECLTNIIDKGSFALHLWSYDYSEYTGCLTNIIELMAWNTSSLTMITVNTSSVSQ